MRNNADWLLSLGAVEFMRDVGKHFSVNVMLAKESVKARLETGISYTEFSYMLLQAYDFLELHRRDGVTLQIGGSDQWGNITAGTELIRRVLGKDAHGLTFPLLTTSAGTKFGKTEAGPVWLDPALTSPYQFYQFWINTEDRDVPRYLRLFTLLPREEIEALDVATAERPERREAQQVLAREVTARVHGAESVRVVEEVNASIFGHRRPYDLSPEALDLLEREIPFAEVPAPDLHGDVSETLGVGGALDVLELFTKAGLAESRGHAKRLLGQNGLTINGEKLTPDQRSFPKARYLPGRRLLLQKGKKDQALVRVRE
jgi:tyrosyl-tRNA synthetase